MEFNLLPLAFIFTRERERVSERGCERCSGVEGSGRGKREILFPTDRKKLPVLSQIRAAVRDFLMFTLISENDLVALRSENILLFGMRDVRDAMLKGDLILKITESKYTE